MKTIKKAAKWLGYVLLALLGVALTAYGYATWRVSQRLNKTYPTHVSGIQVPDDSAAVARGAHLYVVHACRDCHGANLAGRVVLDNPLMGRLVARNLTKGKGGLPAGFEDRDWLRTLKHGVNREGKPLWVMPAHETTKIADADLADIARQVPGGFAGYFLEPAEPAEADGPRAAVPPRTVVRLARPAEGAAALAALAPRLAPYHGGTADVAGARVLPARWDFAQLYDWQRYIGARLRGAVRLTFGDIDEVGNRLVLGVGTERERRALLRRLPRLGVPCGLVEVALVRVGLP